MITFNKKTVRQNINFTKEQQDVLDSSDNSVVVESAPGSGKSTLLLEFMHRNAGKRILYLAYNKAIVEDIRKKVPEGCEVSTFHAFGLGLIRNNIDAMKIDFYKYRKIDNSYGIADMVNKHQLLGGAKSERKWKETCDRFHLSKKSIHQAMDCFETGLNQKEIISGEDMVSMPVRENYVSKPYDMLLIDEANDISMDKLNLLLQIPAERIIFVGDRNQQINQYSGSEPEVFEKILERYSAKTFEINETFRCPAEIIQEAREIVPSIFGSKPGGAVSGIKFAELDPLTMPKESLVLCRSNAPLLKIARALIHSKVDFKISTRTVKNIIRTFNSIKDGCRTINEMKKECNEDMLHEINRFKINRWNPEIPKQKYKAIYAILNAEKNIPAAEAFLKTLLQRGHSASMLALSTCHSAKGLESDNVYYLARCISDHIAKGTKIKWQKQAEQNIQYMGITRSLNKLTYID